MACSSIYQRGSVLSVFNLAFQVVLSDGSATVSLRFFREGQPMPWFRQNEVIAAWAVALLGTHTCACGGRILNDCKLRQAVSIVYVVPC